jgi:FkbM family methyltransferase
MIQTIALRKAVLPAVVFDVGANVGDWTGGILRIANRANIAARVHAFEPCGDTFKLLQARYRDNQDVCLVQRACARTAGSAQMHVYGKFLGTNSLAGPIDERPAESEEVQLTTLDLYCQAARIERIDLLKIDAEGFDFEVMVGASRMLDRKAIRVLQFEYNHRWVGARNYLKDVFSLLAPRGYAIGKITGRQVEFYPRWKWELETWDEGNYVCCLKGDEEQFPIRQPKWLSFG